MPLDCRVTHSSGSTQNELSVLNANSGDGVLFATPENSSTKFERITGEDFSRKESSENYAYTIQEFEGSYRLIECRDNHQWIVQRFMGNRWRSEQYFRTKAALLKCLCKLALCIDELDQLPENFSSRFKHGHVALLKPADGIPCEYDGCDSDHALSSSTDVSNA